MPDKFEVQDAVRCTLSCGQLVEGRIKRISPSEDLALIQIQKILSPSRSGVEKMIGQEINIWLNNSSLQLVKGEKVC